MGQGGKMASGQVGKWANIDDIKLYGVYGNRKLFLEEFMIQVFHNKSILVC
jgi:hypothetical protein